MSTSRVEMWSSIVKEAWQKVFLVAKFFCGLHVTNTYLCSLALVNGPSMVPTLNINGNLVLAERASPRIGKVGPGDIVIVRSPIHPRKVVAKRVIGREGDKVTYVVDPKNSDSCKTVEVPKGHIWVEGDNIYASTDSRNFGAVPYGLLQAKVFWRIWPFKQFGPLGPKAEKVNEP